MNDTQKTALIVGASRALGLALASELAGRGWRVIGTIRTDESPELQAAKADSDGRLTTELLDMTQPDQAVALRDRLEGIELDLLFVNAGITKNDEPTEDVSEEHFVEVLVTNALSPIRTVGTLRSLVKPGGTIGIMSSSQGSISLNERGGHEVYRSSKSALNQLVRSYVARNADDGLTYLLLNPGWVQTDLGGPHAVLTIDDSIPGVADVLEKHAGDGGLQFLDYQDEVVPW